MANDGGTLNVKVGAIVMAAGLSRRMGANKLLADLGGRPIIAHVVDMIRDAGWPAPLIVTGHDAVAVKVALKDRAAFFCHAPDHAAGMSRSIAAAIAAVPGDWAAVAICLGDMPLIRPETLRHLGESARADTILVPVHAGRRGNPALWGRAHLHRLSALDGDTGGKAILRDLSSAVREVACDDGGVLFDIDTAETLRDLRKSFGEETL